MAAVGTTLAVIAAVAVWLGDKLLARSRRVNQARMIVIALIPRLEMHAVLLNAFANRISPRDETQKMVADAMVANDKLSRQHLASFGMRLVEVDIDAEVARFESLPPSVGTQIVRAYTLLASVRGGAEALHTDDDIDDPYEFMKAFREQLQIAQDELGLALDRCYAFTTVRRYKLLSTAAETILRAATAVAAP